MKTFVIRALADTVLEGDEHFTVQLYPAESGAVIDPLNGQYLGKKVARTLHQFIISRLSLICPCLTGDVLPQVWPPSLSGQTRLHWGLLE